jgi:hypothetical protein
MVTARPLDLRGPVDLRCGKRLPGGTRCGRLFDPAVWIAGDRLYGIPFETDLADEIEALRAERPYESPAWMGSAPYTNECRCGNKPKLKYETLTARVREAIDAGETAAYI